MKWIHDPSQSNVDNLNNVRRDASRHFRKKNKAYLKAKIEELLTQYCVSDEIKKNKMGGACDAHEGDRRVQDFGGEI
jgi:hypothetical protein